MPPSVRSEPSLTSTSEPPAIVTLLSRLFVVPLTVLISAPVPLVRSVPPEITAPESRTCAPVPEARTSPVAVLLIVLAIVTEALVPTASMVFELTTVPEIKRIERHPFDHARVDGGAGKRNSAAASLKRAGICHGTAQL